jgi:hypothetical protein
MQEPPSPSPSPSTPEKKKEERAVENRSSALSQVAIRRQLGILDTLQVLTLNQTLNLLLDHGDIRFKLLTQLRKRLIDELLMRKLLALFHDAHDSRFNHKTSRVVFVVLRVFWVFVVFDLVACGDHADFYFDELGGELFVEGEAVGGFDVLGHGFLDEDAGFGGYG